MIEVRSIDNKIKAKATHSIPLQGQYNDLDTNNYVYPTKHVNAWTIVILLIAFRPRFGIDNAGSLGDVREY